uniref:Ovule protein n=1 Tax=Mesocestoides corti TaxID=53468 RepID=A0A5K3EHY5_MESCO
HCLKKRKLQDRQHTVTRARPPFQVPSIFNVTTFDGHATYGLPFSNLTRRAVLSYVNVRPFITHAVSYF